VESLECGEPSSGGVGWVARGELGGAVGREVWGVKEERGGGVEGDVGERNGKMAPGRAGLGTATLARVALVRGARAALFLLALSGWGCGGADDAGEGAGGSDEYCAGTTEWSAEAAALEEQLLELVNDLRAEGGTCGERRFRSREPLRMLDSLRCAARVHSADMLEHDFFSHTGNDGSQPRERMRVAGYEGRAWAENIAAGSATAEDALRQWVESEPHCMNLLGQYRSTGIGYVEGGRYGHLWTQTFGN